MEHSYKHDLQSLEFLHFPKHMIADIPLPFLVTLYSVPTSNWPSSPSHLLTEPNPAPFHQRLPIGMGNQGVHGSCLSRCTLLNVQNLIRWPVGKRWGKKTTPIWFQDVSKQSQFSCWISPPWFSGLVLYSSASHNPAEIRGHATFCLNRKTVTHSKSSPRKRRILTCRNLSQFSILSRWPHGPLVEEQASPCNDKYKEMLRASLFSLCSKMLVFFHRQFSLDISCIYAWNYIFKNVKDMKGKDQ